MLLFFSSLRICFLYHKHTERPCLPSGSSLATSPLLRMTFHNFPQLSCALLLWSMSSLMLAPFFNGSPLRFPMISMGSLGRWRIANQRAAGSARRRCSSSSSFFAIATASCIELKKTYVILQPAPSLCARLGWASGRSVHRHGVTSSTSRKSYSCHSDCPLPQRGAGYSS